MSKSGFKSGKAGHKVRRAGLRLRLLGATLACALFSTGLTGLFLVKSLVGDYRRQSRDQALQTMACAGELTREGRNPALTRRALEINPAIRSLSLIPPAPGAPEQVILAPPTDATGELTTVRAALSGGWHVRGEVALPTLAGAIASLVWPWVLAGLAVTVLFCTLLWPLLTVLLVGPMRRLSSHLLTLGTGQAAGRLEERGSGEIRDLTAAVNRLGATLNERDRTNRANTMAVRYAFMQLRNVVDSLTEGVVVADTSLDTVLVNPAAQELLQVKEHEVAGSSMSVCFTTSIQQRLWPLVSDYEAGLCWEPAGFEVEAKGRVLRFAIAPMREPEDAQGFFGVVITILDVTKDREVEQMKEDFLSSVSHELRTPLTTINSYTEILHDMPPDDEPTRQEFLQIIDKEVSRLTGLVEDLLDLSNLESGRVILHKEPITLKDLFTEPRIRYSSQALESGIDLQFRLPPGSAGSEPVVDCKRIRQVISLLVGNALKFTPKGGRITVTVKELVKAPIAPDNAPPDTLQVAIADNGPGIPEEDRERIFDKFTQGGEVLTGKPHGSGLGLPIARSILTAHGGTITCGESPLGGAHFVLEIPLPATAVEAPQAAPEEAPEGGPGEVPEAIEEGAAPRPADLEEPEPEPTDHLLREVEDQEENPPQPQPNPLTMEYGAISFPPSNTGR